MDSNKERQTKDDSVDNSAYQFSILDILVLTTGCAIVLALHRTSPRDAGLAGVLLIWWICRSVRRRLDLVMPHRPMLRKCIEVMDRAYERFLGGLGGVVAGLLIAGLIWFFSGIWHGSEVFVALAVCGGILGVVFPKIFMTILFFLPV